jgi:hypothetical protein
MGGMLHFCFDLCFGLRVTSIVGSFGSYFFGNNTSVYIIVRMPSTGQGLIAPTTHSIDACICTLL